jgi:hypothetical protein
VQLPCTVNSDQGDSGTGMANDPVPGAAAVGVLSNQRLDVLQASQYICAAPNAPPQIFYAPVSRS